ncbi:hypothetical protein SRHO_G00032060 [Serrasalmus rhombeus]
MAFEEMTVMTKQEITRVLVEYVKVSQEVDGSGLCSGSGTKSASGWLWVNFGKYSIYVSLQDLQLLNHEFSKAYVVDLAPTMPVTGFGSILANIPSIVEGLNMGFEGMTLRTKQEITRVLVEYLRVSHELDGSGLPCGSGTNSAGVWLRVNFGKYSIYVSLQDLQLINHEFSKAYLVHLAPIVPVAGFGSILANIPSIIEGLNMAFEEMTLMTKQEITHVLVDYLKASQEVDGSGLPCGSGTKSASGWLWVNFGKYSIYVSLQDLQLLNHEFSKVDCGTYHVIIEGLNMAFEEMTLMTKQKITDVLVEYLKVSLEVDASGLPCGFGTNSANGWLWGNFGKYSIYVSLQDLQLLNHEFSKVYLVDLAPIVPVAGFGSIWANIPFM